MGMIVSALSLVFAVGVASSMAMASTPATRGFAPFDSSSAACSAESEREEPEEDQPERALASDPLSYTNISQFGQSYSGYLFMYGGPTYFRVVTTDIEVISLNYSGIACSLRLYKAGHCSPSDAVMSISSLVSSNQILILDAGSTYFIELYTSVPGSHFFTITPTEVNSSMVNLGEYVIHLSVDSSNFFGSSISVERFQLSQTSSVGVECSIVSRGLYSMSAELSSTLNFGYDILQDKRQVVANTGYSYYSAIARARNYHYEYTGSEYVLNSSVFSGSFVTEDTVFTCAHTFLQKWDTASGSNDNNFRSKLCALNAVFSPGESNYNLSPGQLSYSDYGQYAVHDVYIPLRHAVLLHGSSVLYTSEDDWAICLTSNTYVGNYSHSTFGLSVPTFSSLSNAQSAGYPGLHKVPDGNSRIWMWDSVPSGQEIQSVDGRNDIFESDSIYSNGGQSGSPLFHSYNYIENGLLKRKAYQFGVLVANVSDTLEPPSEYDFEFKSTRFVKNTHFAMNLYHVLEDTGNEIEA